jgi:hypothetical protein
LFNCDSEEFGSDFHEGRLGLFGVGHAQRIVDSLVNCKALIAIIFHYLHFPIFYKGCSAGNLHFPIGKSAGNARDLRPMIPLLRPMIPVKHMLTIAR